MLLLNILDVTFRKALGTSLYSRFLNLATGINIYHIFNKEECE